MAALGTQTKKVRKPQRLMGMASHDVEGPVLYFEYGVMNAESGTTSGTITTGLTNVIIAIFNPLDSYAITGAPHSTNIVTYVDGIANTLPIVNTNPSGSAHWNYFLIGTVETI